MDLMGTEVFAWLKVWHDWFPVDLIAVLVVLTAARQLVPLRFIPWAIVLVGILY